jgi:rhodanese-related sulfurtransferase
VKQSAGTTSSDAGVPVIVMCRRGIDSVTATSLLRAHTATGTNSSGSKQPDSAPAAAGFSTTLNSVITSTAPATSQQAAAAPPQVVGASTIQNLQGGLVSWTNNIDPSFPIY